MKITVIGQWGGLPRAGEATAGFLFQHEGYNLLVECGSGVVSNLQRSIDLKDINAVIVSHYHYDHFCDVGALIYGRLIKTNLGQVTRCLPIYGHDGDWHFTDFTMEPFTKGIPFIEGEPLELGPFKIEFLETRHPILCYALKISADGVCVVYSADTSYFEELASFSRGADLCIYECSLYSEMEGASIGHMNSTEAAKLANMAGAKELLLTHLPVYGNLNELIEDGTKHYKGKISLASLGWTWESK